MPKKTTKDRSLCWDCQIRSIAYTTTVTGCIAPYGLCRDCYERKAARGNGNCGFGRHERSKEMRENETETRSGIDR